MESEAKFKILEAKVGVIGLGYVGLPLAVEFGKKFVTVGFDINPTRVEELRRGVDVTLEVDEEELKISGRLTLEHSEMALSSCNFFVVTVPTPIDDYRVPDLSPLESACQIVGKHLSHGNVVVFESTVFPGVTEEICVPILEQVSGLTYNKDFYCGYSPERINPGDRVHRLTSVVKVTSGSTPEVAKYVDDVYNEIVEAGTYSAQSIRVAEAAKVIENIQRDINIGLINELHQLFSKIGINTHEVLAAAETKWNFIPFKPGLVGGHCIGVDPYYLIHKAHQIGFTPEVMSSGRRVNDTMAHFYADEAIREAMQKGILSTTARVLVQGLTFKANCPDVRNTKVLDLVARFESFGIEVTVIDPWVTHFSDKATKNIRFMSIADLEGEKFEIVFRAVNHDIFEDLQEFSPKNWLTTGGLFFKI